MDTYRKATDEYLLRRVMGASPEEIMVLLLEGGQRFIHQACQAMGRKDIEARATAVDRVLAIVEEMTVRLNYEDGGEVVENLARIYDWWSHEMLAGSSENSVPRLEKVAQQMGEMKATWEQYIRQQAAQNAQASPQAAATPGGAGLAGGLVG